MAASRHLCAEPAPQATAARNASVPTVAMRRVWGRRHRGLARRPPSSAPACPTSVGSAGEVSDGSPRRKEIATDLQGGDASTAGGASRRASPDRTNAAKGSPAPTASADRERRPGVAERRRPCGRAELELKQPARGGSSNPSTANRAQKEKGPLRLQRPFSNNGPGDALLSRAVSHAVPSALRGLTAVFGMGTGVALSLWSPGTGQKMKPNSQGCRLQNQSRRSSELHRRDSRMCLLLSLTTD